MSDNTTDDKSKSAKDEGEKHPGHVNAVGYAAADSVFKSRLWSIGASIASYLVFKWGFKSQSTEKMAIRAAEIITMPEKGVKSLYSNVTGKSLAPPDLRRNAPLTAALTIGPIIEYIVAIPYFRSALKRINKINSANDEVRAENVRLKGENELLSDNLHTQQAIALDCLVQHGMPVTEKNAAAKIINSGKPASHADAVAAGQETPQQTTR
jgi:hypothetical protein